jgi:hypothetical protein
MLDARSFDVFAFRAWLRLQAPLAFYKERLLAH